VGFLTRLLLGNGTLKPELRAALESEGLVLLEEGVLGSIRYHHFKAPGKRSHGKVTGQCFGLGLSEKRLALYCRSGRSRLIDTPLTEPRLQAFELSLDGDDRLVLGIDFDRIDDPKISGQMTIHMRTPNARRVLEHISARIPQHAAGDPQPVE
jgi:hypothetical protein